MLGIDTLTTPLLASLQRAPGNFVQLARELCPEPARATLNWHQAWVLPESWQTSYVTTAALGQALTLGIPALPQPPLATRPWALAVELAYDPVAGVWHLGYWGPEWEQLQPYLPAGCLSEPVTGEQRQVVEQFLRQHGQLAPLHPQYRPF